MGFDDNFTWTEDSTTLEEQNTTLEGQDEEQAYTEAGNILP